MRLIVDVQLPEGEETTFEVLAKAIADGLESQGVKLIDGSMATAFDMVIERDMRDQMYEMHREAVAESTARFALKAITLGVTAPRTRLDHILIAMGGQVRTQHRSRWKPGAKPNELTFLRLALQMGKHVGNGFRTPALSVMGQIQDEFSRSYGWPQISDFLSMGRCSAMIEHYLSDPAEKEAAIAIHHASIVAHAELGDLEFELPFGDMETYRGYYLKNLQDRHLLRGKWWL